MQTKKDVNLVHSKMVLKYGTMLKRQNFAKARHADSHKLEGLILHKGALCVNLPMQLQRHNRHSLFLDHVCKHNVSKLSKVFL